MTTRHSARSSSALAQMAPMPAEDILGRDKKAHPRGARGRRGKRQKSTLTQMDFVKLRGDSETEAKENLEDELRMIGSEERRSLDGSEKRLAVGREEVKRKEKRGRISNNQSRDTESQFQATAATKSNARRMAPRRATGAPDTGMTRRTRSAVKKAATAATSKSIPQNKNAEEIESHSPIKSGQTPKRSRTVVPSSQSPESLPGSSCQRLTPKTSRLARRPLQERSPNVTPIATRPLQASTAALGASVKPAPRSNICILKYRPALPIPPEISDTRMRVHVGAASRETSQVSRLTAPADTRLQQLSNINHKSRDFWLTRSSSAPEIPESSQPVLLRSASSAEANKELEVEIPETSQGLRRITSAVSDTYLSSPSLLGAGSSRRSKFVDESCIGQFVEAAPLEPSRGSEAGLATEAYHPDMAHDVAGPLERTRTISTIADSQTTDDEDKDRLHLKNQARRVANANTEDGGVSEAQSQSRGAPAAITAPADPFIKPSIPSSVIATADASSNNHFLKTVTIPIKPACTSGKRNPPSDSTFDPGCATASLKASTTAHLTQLSIHPASLTRPSQASTQSPTQNTWIPASSSVAQQEENNRLQRSPLPSPSPSPSRTAIKLKDSDLLINLDDVPFHPHPHPCSLMKKGTNRHAETTDLIPNNCITSRAISPSLEGDEDLDPKSSAPQQQQEPRQEQQQQHNLHHRPKKHDQYLRFSPNKNSRLDVQNRTQGDYSNNDGVGLGLGLDFVKVDAIDSPPGAVAAIAALPDDAQPSSSPPPPLSPLPLPPPNLDLPDSLLESLPGPPGLNRIHDDEEEEDDDDEWLLVGTGDGGNGCGGA